ncbi:MAG TPA: nicotinate-nucleotide adenylyltransferase [Vicinamibacterales bacterium]
MIPAPGRTGILGGTFDPVHVGHIAAADAACRALALDRVILIPSRRPPHRPAQPRASTFHRFAMVSLAVASHSQYVASDLELQRPGPSFSTVTLRRLHKAGYQAWQLFFIIGTDAFAEIAAWHDYPAVLDLAHFVVISRPGVSLGALRKTLPDVAPRMRLVGDGGRKAAGTESCSVFLVNAATPDVSSTEIRARAARGDALTGLVAPEVECHIRKHRLYGS